MNSTVTYKDGNPYAAKARSARSRASALYGPTAHEKGMREAFPLGAGFGHGSVSSRERGLQFTIDRAGRAIEANKRACYWEGKAWAWDNSALIAKDYQQKVKAIEALDEAMRISLAPGDMVSLAFSAALIEVKRVNKRGVTCTHGENWKWNEISIPEKRKAEIVGKTRAIMEAT